MLLEGNAPIWPSTTTSCLGWLTMLKTALRPSCWEEEGAESRRGGGLKEREDDARGRRRGERKEADGLKAIVLEISDGGRGGGRQRSVEPAGGRRRVGVLSSLFI